jgi:HEAT repeat protein
MKKFASLMLLCFLFIGSATIAVAADKKIVNEKDIVGILSGYHSMPNPDYWTDLDPETTRSTLKAIASDESRITFIRARALLALKYFPDDSVETFLTGKATDEKMPYLRASAVEAYTGLGTKGNVGFYEKALADDSTIVRMHAIRGLSMLRTPEAKKALTVAAGDDRNAKIKGIIERAIAGE